MIECLWIKQGNALFPYDPVTEEMLGGIKNGAMVRTDQPHKPRNPDFHRLMMVGLSEVVSNMHPRFHDVEHLIDWLKWKSGMVETIELLPNGGSIVKPESISFSAMDQIKFKAVSEQWREIVLREFSMDLLRDRA